FPRPAGELADRGAGRRVADDHELPRLAVLRARCVGRSFEERREFGVGDGCVGELPARALAGDDREEFTLPFAHDVVRSPMREKEFTYMMRKLGVFAQCLNASVSTPPMRSMTSGVIDLNARSGSSVSIS